MLLSSNLAQPEMSELTRTMRPGVLPLFLATRTGSSSDQEHVGQVVDLDILLVASRAVECLQDLENAGVQNGQVESLEGLGAIDKGEDGVVGREIELPHLNGTRLEVPAPGQVLAGCFALGLAAHGEDDFAASQVQE